MGRMLSYAAGKAGEVFGLEKWKVRLLQGYTIGVYVGTLLTIATAYREPSATLIESSCMVALVIASITWQSIFNAMYLKNNHPQRIMEKAFEEDFFTKQLFFYSDSFQDHIIDSGNNYRRIIQNISQNIATINQLSANNSAEDSSGVGGS